mgnify:CR=1 FL=1|tara:strand:- start:692 stop:1834 length:1143 start_codon:yes stop_codon:yes gene_type:complete
MNFSITKYLNIPVLLLLFFFTTEAYFKIALYSTGEISGLLKVTKGVVLFGLISHLLFKNLKPFYIIGVVFIFFSLGQLTLANSFSKDILITFVKLMFPIILLLFFSTVKLNDKQKQIFFIVFEYIILFNSLVILTGFLFNIQIFNTYLYTGARFGYNGLIVTSATSSYLYSITLIYLFAKYKKAVFKKIPNLIIILSMFFIGTKVSYIFLFSFFASFLWAYTSINKITVMSFLSIIGALIIYLFFFNFGIFNQIRQTDGLISSLMSYRDVLFLKRTLPYINEHWSIVNYLFGGVSDLSTKSQIEFIDIFYFFGIIGGLLYYHLFFKSFLTFKTNIYIYTLLLVLFIIVLLAGNLFGYPSIAIYIVILREYLGHNEQNQHT